MRPDERGAAGAADEVRMIVGDAGVVNRLDLSRR